jgi:hypothetical protein
VSKYYLAKRSEKENETNEEIILLDSLKVAEQNVVFTRGGQVRTFSSTSMSTSTDPPSTSTSTSTGPSSMSTSTSTDPPSTSTSTSTGPSSMSTSTSTAVSRLKYEFL